MTSPSETQNGLAAAAAEAREAITVQIPAEPLGSMQSAQEVPITDCMIKLDYPHQSHNYPGTVNVHARVNCSGVAPATLIVLIVILLENGFPIATPFIGFDNLVEGHSDTPCLGTPASYQGFAAAFILGVPGARPPFLLLNTHRGLFKSRVSAFAKHACR